jgi:hypothetical protein
MFWSPEIGVRLVVSRAMTPHRGREDRMQQTATRPALFALPDVTGLGGAVAGLLAGIVMILVSPLLSWLNGISMWVPARLIAVAAPGYGPEVLEQTGFAVGPIATALVLHLLTSVVLGFIFGVVVHRVLGLTTDFALPVYIGAAYGLIVFFIAYFVILPFANPVMRDSYIGALVAQNVIYGLFLGVFYIMLRPRPYPETLREE